MKILIAEDDATSRFMLRSLLEKHGYDVVEVSDGNEALDALQGEGTPLLAILDWMLPGKSGPDIIRSLPSESLLETERQPSTACRVRTNTSLC